LVLRHQLKVPKRNVLSNIDRLVRSPSSFCTRYFEALANITTNSDRFAPRCGFWLLAAETAIW
jgi:hypothetical protein